MKRWFTKLVVFLLLGALINVAVAWSISLAHGAEASVRDAAFSHHAGKRKPTSWEIQWYHSKEQK